MTTSLHKNASIKVSSALDKGSGKHLVDGNPETCWTSQQGLPQFIQFTFNENVLPTRLSITFQGGFVGTRTVLCVPGNSSRDWRSVASVYPEDVNRVQTFDIKIQDDQVERSGINSCRLVFEESSDFFGRITIYDLQLDGLVTTTP